MVLISHWPLSCPLANPSLSLTDAPGRYHPAQHTAAAAFPGVACCVDNTPGIYTSACSGAGPNPCAPAAAPTATGTGPAATANPAATGPCPSPGPGPGCHHATNSHPRRPGPAALPSRPAGIYGRIRRSAHGTAPQLTTRLSSPLFRQRPPPSQPALPPIMRRLRQCRPVCPRCPYVRC